MILHFDPRQLLAIGLLHLAQQLQILHIAHAQPPPLQHASHQKQRRCQVVQPRHLFLTASPRRHPRQQRNGRDDYIDERQPPRPQPLKGAHLLVGLQPLRFDFRCQLHGEFFAAVSANSLQ